MAARHTSLSDLHFRRSIELRQMLGTGQGIQRTPTPHALTLARLPLHLGTPAPRAYQNEGLASMTFLDVLKGAATVEYPTPNTSPSHRVVVFFGEYDGLPMQTDMAHYRVLAREARELEAGLKHYTNGHTFDASIFGADRFRPFDPLPAFETVIGPLRFIQQ